MAGGAQGRSRSRGGRVSEAAIQMSLLDESAFPEDHDLVELVEGRSFLPAAGSQAAYSGKLVLAELRGKPEVAEAICTALLRGLHLKQVARMFSRSPKTIKRIRQAMEA